MTENQKCELFEEGVRLILSGWTALRLAIENSWGGDASRMKAQELEEDVIYWFSLNKTAPDPMKLEEQLFAALLEDFNTQVEDDSLLQVAQNMVDLYHDCRSGKTTILDRLRATAQPALQQQVGFWQHYFDIE